MLTNKVKKLIASALFVLSGSALTFYLYLYPYVDRVIEVNEQKIFVQERTNSQQWQKGLSDRKKLCDHCGMLFLFPEKQSKGFWMKDMQFDIDILWINDTEVVHIEKNVSHKTPEKVYKPQEEVNAVLELPAGKAQKLNIQKGTIIKL